MSQWRHHVPFLVAMIHFCHLKLSVFLTHQQTDGLVEARLFFLPFSFSVALHSKPSTLSNAQVSMKSVSSCELWNNGTSFAIPPHLSLSLSLSLDLLPPHRFLPARSRPLNCAAGSSVSLTHFGSGEESLFLAPGSCCSVGRQSSSSFFLSSISSLSQLRARACGEARESYAAHWLCVELRGWLTAEGEEEDNRTDRAGRGATTNTRLITYHPSGRLSGPRLTACPEMASPAAGRDVPNAPPRDDSERQEPHHPEPACQEAQKWIEVSEVTARRGSGGMGGTAAAATAHKMGHTVTHWDINTQPSSTGASSPVVGTMQCRVTVWDDGSAACVDNRQHMC